jgi:hypothetical protein
MEGVAKMNDSDSALQAEVRRILASTQAPAFWAALVRQRDAYHLALFPDGAVLGHTGKKNWVESMNQWTAPHWEIVAEILRRDERVHPIGEMSCPA